MLHRVDITVDQLLASGAVSTAELAAPLAGRRLFVNVFADFGTCTMPGIWKIFFTDCVVPMARSEAVLTLPMRIAELYNGPYFVTLVYFFTKYYMIYTNLV